MNVVKILKKIFEREPPISEVTSSRPDSNVYRFHEDSYQQIEFILKENFTVIKRTDEEIANQLKESPDDNGWKNCYVSNELDIPIAIKQIPLVEITEFLKRSGFSEFSKVTTDNTSTVIECENIRAFKNKSIVVCFDFVKDYLNKIWLNTSPYQDDNNLYKQFLLTLSSKYPFFLSDWNNATIVDISDPEEIDRYFLLDK